MAEFKQNIISELEKVLEKIECDIEVYYDNKLTKYIVDGPKEHQGFYRGGLASLGDVKRYLKSEIKRIKKIKIYD